MNWQRDAWQNVYKSERLLNHLPTEPPSIFLAGLSISSSPVPFLTFFFSCFLTMLESLIIRMSAGSSTSSETTKYGQLTASDGVVLTLQIRPSRTLPSKGTPALLIESALSLDAISKSPLTQRSIRLKRSASSVQYAILKISWHDLYIFAIQEVVLASYPLKCKSKSPA